MQRVKYLLRIVIAGAVQLPVLVWFFAPYNSTGLALYLPNKSFLTYLLAIVIIAISAAWFQRAVPPPRSALLSRRAILLLDTVFVLVGFIALARFSVPLIWSNFPIFGSKLRPTEYMAWAGLLFVDTTLMRALPLFAQNLLPTADELLANDCRKPVVYFRSFEKELSKTGASGIMLPYLLKMRSPKAATYAFSTSPGNTFYGGRMRARGILNTRRSRFDEQMVFADALSAIGPYVALGRPIENFRDMDLGAAKKYVSNDEWKDAVVSWLKNCAAIVLEAGDSASLGWEIEQIVRLIPPTAVLIICPIKEEDYQAFVRAHEHLFPRGLPEFNPKSRLLIFNNNWWSNQLENVNLNATETLQPFFEQVRTGIATEYT
jgi:hypothetical protein